ncbi:MAG: hypothetical protein VB082_04050 [Christensenella sp.]|nr:hypothetical protein [Christensenella sp.]
MAYLEKKVGLLDVLAKKLRCEYLSQLRKTKLRMTLKEALVEIDPLDYGISEWNDAIQYITDEKIIFENVKQAKEYFLAQLEKMSDLLKK